MPASLQTQDPRRNPAPDDGGHHDGNIDLRFFIESGANAGDPPAQTYRRDTFDSADQAHHHIPQRLIQFVLLNSFRTTTTFQHMGDALKNR
jgi:hypothetical protein